MKVIGITGGVAAGKSALAEIFAQRGFPIIDADALAHAALAPGGPAEAAVRSAFGTTARSELRQKVFGDAAARARLEAILHPLIQAESRRLLDGYRAAGHAVAFYEAALLVETGRYRELDGLIVVRADPQTRLHRLLTRALTRDQAEAILRAQLGDDERAAVATWVFTNDGHPDHLRRQADDWIARNAKA